MAKMRRLWSAVASAALGAIAMVSDICFPLDDLPKDARARTANSGRQALTMPSPGTSKLNCVARVRVPRAAGLFGLVAVLPLANNRNPRWPAKKIGQRREHGIAIRVVARTLLRRAHLRTERPVNACLQLVVACRGGMAIDGQKIVGAQVTPVMRDAVGIESADRSCHIGFVCQLARLVALIDHQHLDRNA